MRRLLNRRLFGASLLAGTGVLSVQRLRTSGRITDRRRPRSRVAILHAHSYARSLEERIRDGLRLFGLKLRGKTVLPKPNLVEYIPGAEVNTNPLLIAPRPALSSRSAPRPWLLRKVLAISGTRISLSLRAALNRSCGTASSISSI